MAMGILVTVIWTMLTLQIQRTIADMADTMPFSLTIFATVFAWFFEWLGFGLTHNLLRGIGASPNFGRYVPPMIQLLGTTVAYFIGYVDFPPLHALLNLYQIWFEHDMITEQTTGRLSKIQQNAGDQTGRKRTYRHRRLSNPRAIRILVLSASKDVTAPITCQLIEAVLDEAPEYIALSYAWDSHEGTTEIICNGASLDITANCARALHRIREMIDYPTQNLWVDAICIDQGTDAAAEEERLQQIQIMGQVYKRASRVIAWLGEHDTNSQTVCGFFGEVGDAYSYADGPLATERVLHSALEHGRHWATLSESLGYFFRRSWFTRMWPIQEVALPLPGRVSLVCGDSTISLEYLRISWYALETVGLLPSLVNLDQAVALQFYLAEALALKRNSQRNELAEFGPPLLTDLSQFSLSSVMAATRFKACTLPKDKFFALYGVLQELEIPHKLSTSMYSQSEAEIFRAVFDSCTALDGNLDALRFAQSSEDYLSHDDFLTTRNDRYDSFGTAVFSACNRTVTQTRNVLLGKGLDRVPRWRTDIPSWIPDWTQWTSSDPDPARDIKLVSSYSPIRLFSVTGPSANGIKIPDQVRRSRPKVDAVVHTRDRCSPGTRRSLEETLKVLKVAKLQEGIAYKPCNLVSKSSIAAHGSLHQHLAATSIYLARLCDFSHHGALRDDKLGYYNSLFHINQGHLEVEAKLLGVVTEVGTVNSLNLLWQGHSASYYAFKRQWRMKRQGKIESPVENFFRAGPDPVLGALIESVRNFVWRSFITQFILSLRMAIFGLGLTDYSRYAYSLWFASAFSPNILETVCSLYPSIASCPTDGYRMREEREKHQITHGWLDACFWFAMVMLVHAAMGHWIAFKLISRTIVSTFLISGLVLLWNLQASVFETLYGRPFGDFPSWFNMPIMGIILGIGLSLVARVLEDDTLSLVGRASMSIFNLWGSLAVARWFWWVTQIVIVPIASRAIRNPCENLMEVIGTEKFRRNGAYTSGIHFFRTETGITGNTSGPIRCLDVLVLVNGASDCIVMRLCGTNFKIIGAAYVGNKSRQELEESVLTWKRTIII
jgi:hypothetical protein